MERVPDRKYSNYCVIRLCKPKIALEDSDRKSGRDMNYLNQHD